MIDYFGIDKHQHLNFKSSQKSENSKFPFPSGLKIKKVLKEHLDLHGSVTFINKQVGHFEFGKNFKSSGSRETQGTCFQSKLHE